MIRKTILIISVLTFTIFFQANKSSAEQIVLCMSDAEQYAVIVDSKDECLEDEVSNKMMGGRDIESKKKYMPLLKVSPNNDCTTQGFVRTFGFDVNNNGSLDENEIESTSRICKLETEESDE